MVAPAQVVPFADDQELGEAWHAVVGFTRAVPTEQQMHSLLVDNLVFALVRCAASPDSFFFVWSHQGSAEHFSLPAACTAESIPLSQVRILDTQVALFAGTISKQ